MKNLKLLQVLSTMMLTAVSCDSKKETPEEETPKMLVFYYSQNGNPKAVAEKIANMLGADFSGKKIVPFCTFGSGGLESSVKDLMATEPNVEILSGYGIRIARLEAMHRCSRK